MSLLNIPGVSQEDIVTQIVNAIKAAPDSAEKTEFIRDLAAKLSAPAPAPEPEDEGLDMEDEVQDYRDEHEYHCYNDDHEDIEQRGKLVFIDDCSWDHDYASVIFADDPEDYAASDFDEVDNNSISIESAIENLEENIEMFQAAKRSLERIKDNGGEYVIWNDDESFDYECGNPNDI